MQCLSKHANTGEVVDVYAYVKRAALDAICGESLTGQIVPFHDHKRLERPQRWVFVVIEVIFPSTETAMGISVEAQTKIDNDYAKAVRDMVEETFKYVSLGVESVN